MMTTSKCCGRWRAQLELEKAMELGVTKHQKDLIRSDIEYKQLLILSDQMVYYLASPYTAHRGNKRIKKKIEDQRHDEVTRLAIRLIKEQNLTLILPITTSHALRAIDPTIGTTWDDWAKTDSDLVRKSDVLLVAFMPGVNESRGVAAEIKVAQENHIPVLCIDPLTLAVWRY